MRVAAYPTYKSSGVEWLGEVPEHWITWKAAHGFRKIGSGTTPKSDNPEYYDGDIPWVTTTELRETVIMDTSAKITSAAIQNFSALRMYPVGTLLFAMYGATIGRLGILGIPATVNQACAAFVDPIHFDSQFVYYWLQMRRPTLIALSVGGGQPNLSQDDLRQLRIPVPSLLEQRVVADFLDRETSRIDTLIAKKQTLIDRLSEKRSALISQAVTKGLDPTAPMRSSNIDWLGEVPRHWSIAPLYARFWLELGKMLDSNQISGDHLVPYLRNADVQWDRIETNNLPEMDVEPREYRRFILAVGDLLVCEGGEVGRAAIWRGEVPFCAYQKAIHRIRPRSVGNDNVRFLFYVFRHAASTGVFVASGNPNTIPHLTGEQLRVYRFPFPPPKEQAAIAAYLDDHTRQLDSLAEVVGEAIERLLEYRSALISAAVTGKIDVRGRD